MLTLAFPNDFHFLLFITVGHLFSRPTSQNTSVFSSDSHFFDIDLITDQYSTPPTHNRVDNSPIVNKTHVTSPRQDPRFLRFLYLATHKLTSSTHTSDEHRRKEFHRLDTTNREFKFEITAKFHILRPRPIPSHTNVNFNSIPNPFLPLFLMFS